MYVRKRIFTTLLVMVLLTSFSVGCNSQSTGESSSAASSKASSAAPESKAEEKAPPKQVTVKVTKNSNDTTPSESTENAVIWQAIHDKFLADRNIDLTLDIEFVLWQEAMTKLQMKFAANEELDFFAATTDYLSAWTTSDLGPLRSIGNELNNLAPNLKAKYDADLFTLTTRQNEIVALPTGGNNWCYGISIRTDILKELGLLMPKTFEEFEAMLAKMKEKYPDSTPLASPMGYLPTVAGEYFVGANTSGTAWYFDENGEARSWGQEKKYLDWAKTEKKWLDNGWVSKDNAQHQMEDTNRMLLNNQSFVLASDFDFDTLVKDIKTAIPEADFAPLLECTTVYGTPAKLRWSNPTVVCYGAYKNAKQEALEAFIQYYDWAIENEDNYHLTRYGIEGTHYTIENGMRNIAPAFIDNTNFYKSLYGFATNASIPGYNLYANTTLPSAIEWYNKIGKADIFALPNPVLQIPDLGSLATAWGDAWSIYNEKIAKFKNGQLSEAEIDKAYEEYISSDNFKDVTKLIKDYNS